MADYTSNMRKLDMQCRSRHGMGLREFLLARANGERPYDHGAVAAELGIDRSTLYDYYPRLELGRAHGLVDLRAARERDALRRAAELCEDASRADAAA